MHNVGDGFFDILNCLYVYHMLIPSSAIIVDYALIFYLRSPTLLRLVAVMSIFFKLKCQLFSMPIFLSKPGKENFINRSRKNKKQSDYFTGLIYKNTYNIKLL